MKKSMRKLLVLCLTLTMLVVNSLSVLGAVAGDFNVTFKFIDEDTNEVVKTADHVVNGTEGENILVDVESMMPENYKLAECSDNGFGYVVVTPYSDMKNVKDVFVKKVQTIPTETVLNVTFETVDGTKVGTATASTTAVGGEGEAWTFMLGTDFNLPKGYQLATGVDQVTSIDVPFGSTAGHTMIVEAIPTETTETVLNVTFETVDGTKVGTATASTTAVGGEGEAWTFMLGTDFNLPKGYQLATGVEQVTNIDVPFGSTAGHTMVVEAIPTETTETVLNVTFETVDGTYVGETTASTTAVGGEGEAWTFMLGTDFNLPEGYQLATGVDQVTNIDVPFGAIGGHTMIVEAIPAETTETVLNVTFETVAGEVVGTTTASTTAVGGEGEAWTFMLGTDFNLPEGYQLATGVEQVTNIDVPFGAIGGHTMVVEAIPTVDPVDPVDPVTPVQPTTPDNSNKENTATDNKVTDKADKKADKADKKADKADKKADKADKKADKAKEAKSPKTGDMTNVAMNAFVMVICAIAIVTVICRKRYARK